MASDHLLALGLFAFGMDTISYQDLERRTDWNYGRTARYGARDVAQFTGPGSDTITLNGVLVPELAGHYSDLDRLREMGDSGKEHSLARGDGTVLGRFIIMALDTREQNIIKGGRPRRYDFALDLQRVD
ncbi:phage tail protein [Altericroceibacterium endophyticum]|uniref:Oxidoreductase n=1 Tax=Altericroceibacterium endophyticum TaxID=1808508 RepID=A0A6I4T1Q0_9SPHN|nr:phage tail protein [Altericroceibacterium endophyticum]MXO64866.1 oxidoreductase [Altericroceibacterium endophyticum]